MLVDCCLLFGVWGLVLVVVDVGCVLRFVARCWLVVVSCLLFIVRCCILFAVCYSVLLALRLLCSRLMCDVCSVLFVRCYWSCVV